MSFIRGMWRLLGANDADDEPERKIVEYPVTAGGEARHNDAVPSELDISVADESMICIIRPGIDGKGNPDYSLKQYAAFLLSRRPLLMDLSELADKHLDEAGSILHYLSGVVEAVDGTVWEVQNQIYLFTPSNVVLAGDPLRQIEVR